jgi:23S rRNA (adenine2030-N6)-methyltransferase
VNYRHAFHAGNFADCMKHALLVWLLRAIARKPAPFAVLDTHAGAGRYDLEGEQAARTGEWRGGIARLTENPPPELADYVALVRACGLYPGSPVLIRALLRPQDRLICCERHPEEYAALKRALHGDARVSMHHRDAWEALGGLLPPAERRGLVFIDPPYEAADEFSRLAAGLRAGHARFATGVFAAWYPIKHRAPVREFHARMRAMRDVVAAELWLREPLDAARLNGCGLLLINPPYRFEAEAPPILRALLARLDTGEAGAGVVVERLSDE